MIAALALAAALVSSRVRIAELDVVGPVSGLVLDSGSAGETRFSQAFRSGERLRVSAPVAVVDAAAPVPPAIRWSRDGDLEEAAPGSVRFARWREDRAAEDLAALPPGLLARPRPPVSPPEVRASRATLALLPACFVLGLAVRRRRAVALLVGILGGALLLAAGWPRGGRRAMSADVLEGDAGSEASLWVSASFGRASGTVEELEGALLELPEERTRIVWSQAEEGDAWTASAPGTSIYLLRKVELGEEGYTRARNRNRPLAEAWVREDGAWTSRGPWPMGEPLPAPRDAPPPPGWLEAGLPQGVPILIGRVADDPTLFVRISGF